VKLHEVKLHGVKLHEKTNHVGHIRSHKVKLLTATVCITFASFERISITVSTWALNIKIERTVRQLSPDKFTGRDLV